MWQKLGAEMELACSGGLPLNSFYTLGFAQHTCGFHAGLKL
jgi:hypothetical protein